MTGFEIAGVALAVPPLIFYALDNYKRMLKPLTRYARFESALGDLEAMVNTSQLKFSAEIQILLSAIFDEDEAWAMVTDPNHPSWHDQDLDTKQLLKSHLDTTGSYDTFLLHVGCIVKVIQPLQAEVSELVSGSLQDSGDKRPSKRQRAKILKERLGFSFKDDYFKKRLGEIDTHVRELKNLVEQRDRIAMTRKLYKSCAVRKGKKVNSLQPFVVIQESSKALFETVQCTRHTAHNTHLGLLPRIEDLKVAQIWFDLLFPSILDDSYLTPNDLGLLLRIESCLRSKEALKAEQNQTAGNSISVVSPTPSIPSQLILLSHALAHEPRTKRVRFETESPCAEDFAAVCSTKVQTLAPDFCQWLSQNIRATTTKLPEDRCIGCLDRNARHQLRFHIEAEVASRKKPVSISLRKLLEMMKAGHLKGRLPFREKLRFARILASAVLSFYNTPWLSSGAWDTANIVFCNVDADADLDTNPLPDPYISVSVTAAKAPQPTSDNIHITNLLVFRLGIMLLELAFEQPLESMQIPADRAKASDPLDIQFATAKRLLRDVKDKTGSHKYEEVVEKCLLQYGRDEPLERCSEAKRVQYHSDIVQELQGLEDKLRDIYLGG
ncbi:hypothetical protein FH972_023088 [Carpinus fangiana]|uniref:DUF7580 domain-containing protein n=1 Tax=Carpinus fangiana TaxID=176857 RepID=A0A5N6KU53_9ROSI|nr:hypothetical protein FH972_023088 [Carpinus fangiana]